MPVNRALKAARVPCALFAALEAKRHHHPQLAQRCISAACAALRACHQLRLLLLLRLLRFYCRLLVGHCILHCGGWRLQAHCRLQALSLELRSASFFKKNRRLIPGGLCQSIAH